MNRCICFCVFCLLIAARSEAVSLRNLPDGYTRRVWKTQDGLPENTVQAFAQTPDHCLCIGTSGGLARFDGAKFVVFDRSGALDVRPRNMIHIDRGGDKVRTKEFFHKLNSYHVNYNVIGQSYYPWWHGSLNDLRENMTFMAKEYKKDIIVVEAAYNWMPAEYKKIRGPFPETPDGQKQFLQEVNRIVQETPDGLGKGVFWWEAAVTGPLGSRVFFDEKGNALPMITTFDKFTRR